MLSSIVSFADNLLQLYPYSLLTQTLQTESNPVLHPGRPVYFVSHTTLVALSLHQRIEMVISKLLTACTKGNKNT